MLKLFSLLRMTSLTPSAWQNPSHPVRLFLSIIPLSEVSSFISAPPFMPPNQVDSTVFLLLHNLMNKFQLSCYMVVYLHNSLPHLPEPFRELGEDTLVVYFYFIFISLTENILGIY